MHSLYNEQVLLSLNGQICRRRIVLGAVSLVLLALIVLAVLQDDGKQNRPELLVSVLVIFTGCFAIFFHDLMIRPLRSYFHHVDRALHGRSHEADFIFDRLSEDVSLVEGVAYRDLIFLGEPDKHGDRERMFYWDSELPLPAFEKGQQVSLHYYDRFITGYRV